MHQRKSVLVLALLAGGLAMTLFPACGRKEQPAPAQGAKPPGELRPGPGGSVGPASSTVPAPEAPKPTFVVGNDEAGFNQAQVEIDRRTAEADFSGAAAVAAEMLAKFPARQEEVGNLLNTLKQSRRDAADLGYAVDQLRNADRTMLDEAIRKLSEGGETARILLRKAVRERDDVTVGNAAAVLAELQDAAAFTAILDRFRKKTDSPARIPQLAALTRLAGKATGASVALLMPMLQEDTPFGNRDVVSVLVAYCGLACGGDPARFDKDLSQPGAAEQVRGYITKALETSATAEVQTWAAAQAESMGVLVPGIRCQLYGGGNFESLVQELQLDKINVADRQFPYPDGRQDNISVRWLGKFLAPTDGSYTFTVSSDDGNRMWLDDKKLFDDWGSPCNHRVTVELKQGLHELKIEFQQGGGGAWITASWSGPGIPERALDKEHLRVIPWKKQTTPAAAPPK